MADPMEDMEAMDMARGRLRLLLMLSLVIEAMDTAATADLMEAMEVMAGPMEDMEAMDMARGRLRLLLMLSLVIEAMDTAATADLMEVMADPMEDMEAMISRMHPPEDEHQKEKELPQSTFLQN